MTRRVQPTLVERRFGDEDIIVSKTDLRGRITYTNDVFLRVAEYGEADVLGQPHNVIRHPDMPRCVFKLLWDTLEKGQEIFAYVKNMTAKGDYYWVFAHVTPSFDAQGRITGYHSNRRAPARQAVAKIEPIYRELVAEEKRHANAKDGMAAAFHLLVKMLADKGVSYEQFVFSLAGEMTMTWEKAA